MQTNINKKTIPYIVLYLMTMQYAGSLDFRSDIHKLRVTFDSLGSVPSADVNLVNHRI